MARALAAVACVVAFSLPGSAVPRRAEHMITIDLVDADIVNVIRLIGDVSGRNVVVGDDVKGRVTVKLRNVGWRQALRVVLQSGGYGLVEEDGVLRVASLARLKAEERARFARVEDEALRGPLVTQVIPVRYARAEEMMALVKPLLSPRGSVAVDVRTNTLIVRDVASSAAHRF